MGTSSAESLCVESRRRQEPGKKTEGTVQFSYLERTDRGRAFSIPSVRIHQIVAHFVVTGGLHFVSVYWVLLLFAGTNIAVRRVEDQRKEAEPHTADRQRKGPAEQKLDRPPIARSWSDYLIRAIFFTTSVSAVLTLYRYTPVET